MPKIEADVVLALGEHLPAVDVWLVVDVLRASTVIVRWFELGGGNLFPVESIPAARRLAAELAKNSHAPLLMGEENAIIPKGFELGNSPLDLTEKIVRSHSCAVMATTNGTGALLAAAETGVPVLTACIRNAAAAVSHALTLGSKIGILCAGRKRRPAWDDTLCAGLLLETLAVYEPDLLLTDSARLALLTLHSSTNLLRSLRGADHAIFLDKLGYGPDIDFACERNVATVVPVLREELVGDEGAASNSVGESDGSIIISRKLRAVLECVNTNVPANTAEVELRSDDLPADSTASTVSTALAGRSFASLLGYTARANDTTALAPRAESARDDRDRDREERDREERVAKVATSSPFFLGGRKRERDRIDRVITRGGA